MRMPAISFAGRGGEETDIRLCFSRWQLVACHGRVIGTPFPARCSMTNRLNWVIPNGNDILSYQLVQGSPRRNQGLIVFRQRFTLHPARAGRQFYICSGFGGYLAATQCHSRFFSTFPSSSSSFFLRIPLFHGTRGIPCKVQRPASQPARRGCKVSGLRGKIQRRVEQKRTVRLSSPLRRSVVD